MSVNRSPLGKGLSSLIPYNRENNSAVTEISISNIVPNPEQPRKIFSEQEIVELSRSIEKFGILQPILVNKKREGKYIIIAGERRWQAAKKLGLQKLPVIVKEINDEEVIAISIIENIQRQDLNPLEEAKAYKVLMEKYSYTQEKIADKLSKSRSHVANLLRLLKLPLEAQKLLEENKISLGHAKLLSQDSDPISTAKLIAENKWSVRQSEEFLKKSKPTHNHSTKRVSHLSKLHANNHADYEFVDDQDIINIENMLTEALGGKVKILEKSFGGQIIIDFYNLDQLDSIVTQLSTRKNWL